MSAPPIKVNVRFSVIAYNSSWEGYVDDRSRDFSDGNAAVAYAETLPDNFKPVVWKNITVDPISIKVWPKDCECGSPPQPVPVAAAMNTPIQEAVEALRLAEKRFLWLANDLDAQLNGHEAFQARIRELEALVYVPGAWSCKKCGFSLMQAVFRASDGAVGARDEPGEKCPNCNVPLWRRTEREAGNELVDRLQEEIKRRVDLEAREKKLSEALEFYANDDNWRLNGPLDPNSGNFIGRVHARAALSTKESGDAG